MPCWVPLLVIAIASAQQGIAQSEAHAVVEGRVVHNVTKEPVRKATVTLGQYADANGFELVATTDDAGHFRFANVKPGVYKLMADKPGFLAGSYGALKQEDLGSVVKVSAGDRMLDLTLPIFPAGVISGQVLDSDGDPAPAGSVFLNPVKGGANADFGSYQFEPHNGAYVFGDVTPGIYQIGFTNANGAYLKSVQSGGRLLDAQSIEVGEGASLDLLLTYSKNVASVSGDVEVRQDQPKSPVHVFLIEQDAPMSLDRAFTADLEQTLRFSIENRRPGKYLAIAAQKDDFDPWNDERFIDAMRSAGSELELHEKDHATVHLKLITQDITDCIRRQLGI